MRLLLEDLDTEHLMTSIRHDLSGEDDAALDIALDAALFGSEPGPPQDNSFTERLEELQGRMSRPPEYFSPQLYSSPQVSL